MSKVIIERKQIRCSNAELCAMWLNDEIPLSEYMRNFNDEESSEPQDKDEV